MQESAASFLRLGGAARLGGISRCTLASLSTASGQPTPRPPAQSSPDASEIAPRTFSVTLPGTGDRLVADSYCARDSEKRARGSIILLHGGGQTRHSWARSCVALAQRGFRAVTLDLKGHGESYWCAEKRYHFRDFASDLDGFLHVCGFRGGDDSAAANGGSISADSTAVLPGASTDAPVLVGASLGGLTALLSRFGKRRAKGMVLVDVTPRLEKKEVTRILQFMGAAQGFATVEEAAEAISRYFAHRDKPQDLSGIKKVLRFDEVTRTFRFHWDPALLDSIGLDKHTPEAVREAHRELLEAAAEVEVPLLVIRGAQSELVSMKGVEEIMAVAKTARFVEVPNTRHMVAGDDNVAFNDTVVAFIEGISRAPTSAGAR